MLGTTPKKTITVVRTGEPGTDRRGPDTTGRMDCPRPYTCRYPELAPDLAVEVKSPSNSNPEMAAKAQMWLCYGSQVALVLDPATTTVRIYRPNTETITLGEDDVLDLGELLPGFACPVWRLFRRQR